MTAIRWLSITYLIGVLLLTCAMGIVVLNLAAMTYIDPSVGLLGGFLLLFGSKLLMRIVQRKARAR